MQKDSNKKRILSMFGTKSLEMQEKIASLQEEIAGLREQPKAYYGYEYPIRTKYWDGEKTKGELGAPVEYINDYDLLRARSWQIFTESDVAKIIVNQLVNWVIGPGLKAQSKPSSIIIENEGFNLDIDNFTQLAEQRFRIWSSTDNASYDRDGNMHRNARLAYLNSIVSGDCLVIFRYKENVISQVIDGSHVRNPNMEYVLKAEERGNEIIYGVERNAKTKEHVAYWVVQNDNTYKRILARGSRTGRVQAKLLYADEHRVGEVRGMPLYSASIEKMKKIDRYIEAMVGGAEERAKLPYFFEHNHFSDGEPILAGSLREASGYRESDDPQGPTVDESARKVLATTGKTVSELPVGVTIKSLESTTEMRLKEFTETNFIYICASVGMPYEVALMKYENSFSASRMASQSFQQIMVNKRADFSSRFYKPQWDIFLETEIIKGKIPADGYFEAFTRRDTIFKEAYHHVQFVGHSVPQADPTKEVKASLMKLAGMLSNIDQESETLGTGDFNTNFTIYLRELNKIKEQNEDIYNDIVNKS